MKRLIFLVGIIAIGLIAVIGWASYQGWDGEICEISVERAPEGAQVTENLPFVRFLGPESTWPLFGSWDQGIFLIRKNWSYGANSLVPGADYQLQSELSWKAETCDFRHKGRMLQLYFVLHGEIRLLSSLP